MPVDATLSRTGVPSSVVQVNHQIGFVRNSFSLGVFVGRRTGWIQGARLSERREKRHLRQSRENLARDYVRRSGLATPDSQVTRCFFARRSGGGAICSQGKYSRVGRKSIYSTVCTRTRVLHLSTFEKSILIPRSVFDHRVERSRVQTVNSFTL